MPAMHWEDDDRDSGVDGRRSEAEPADTLGLGSMIKSATIFGFIGGVLLIMWAPRG